ncbi:cytochrome c oxidase subunit 6B2 [Lasioglossum baleicum]|uniref:cytochrome c oxidase subunit 6B2 n=1 Tax=Lasioglossum baleicum TaxID=434251 RepID=UPI003FCD8E9A
MSFNNKNDDRVPEVTRYKYPENAGNVTAGATSTLKLVEDKPKPKKKKIIIEVDEDDPCLQDKEQEVVSAGGEIVAHGLDPRFQQQDQTVRCWVMYTDFYRCERILGAGSDACNWFKQVFTSTCPNDWIRYWDVLRTEGKFAWHKYKKQGDFPGDKYGE